MANIEKHTATITAAIEAHRAILDKAEQRAAADTAAFAGKQQAEKASLAPVAEAMAGLTNRLNALLSKRETLAEALRIGNNQLSQQQAALADFESRMEGNFGNVNVASNAGIFLHLAANFPAGVVAMHVLPRLRAWIAARQDDLAEVEAAIAELAQSAKSPKALDV